MTLKIALYPYFRGLSLCYQWLGEWETWAVFRMIDSCCVQGIIFFAEALGILWRIRQSVTSVA